MANEKNCILRSPCDKAGSEECTTLCPHFIALHGHSGEGGRVANASIPRDYKNLTLQSSPIRDSEPEAYRVFDGYVSTFKRQFEEDGERIKNLYLYSRETGNGKTTSAAILANEYIYRHYIGSIMRGRKPSQRPALFLDLIEFQMLYNEHNRKGIPEDIAAAASEKYYMLRKLAMEVPFLVMDEIGGRTYTEAFGIDVHTIINRRTTERKPTVYTSNVPINELASQFDRKLWDRVRDMTQPVSFKGTSKRGKRKEVNANE